MSSCSFASYIQMRTAAFCSSPSSPSSGPTSVAASPTLVHLAPSPVRSTDSASPHKRQRNKSPSPSSPSPSFSPHDSPADSPTTPTVAKPGPKVDPLSYFFAASATNSASTAVLPKTAAPSPVCPLRSILCTSHFDESGSLVTPSTSSPATSSPPVSRPISRRSSTSTSTTLSRSTSTSHKSVRFARCTNASVFPTHSTEDYDRSPIVPTGEKESLEIYRCPRGGGEGEDGEGGGWIMCHAKKAGGVEGEGKRKRFLPSSSSSSSWASGASTGGSMMPVEGVRGLFAGSYFEGEERDHPLFPASTPACGTAGVVIPEAEEEDEDDEDQARLLGEGIGDDGELMEVDDSAEAEGPEEVEMEREEPDAEVEAEVGAMELLAVSTSSDRRRGSDSSAHSSSSASSATSTDESHPHRASSPSTPTSSPPAEFANDEERERDKAQRCAERKKRFGLIGLGKYTRQELFQSHDSLSGF
ncbi:hypothetical protein JCM10295v2_005994 [Rhodotorula toruloides]